MATRQARYEDDFADETRSVDLRDYWLVVRRRIVSVILLTVIGAALGVGYAKHTKPHFKSTAQVLVTPVTAGPLDLPAQVSQLVNMSTEETVAQSVPVIALAARTLGMPETTLQSKVAGQLTVSIPTESQVLQITWKAGTSRAAQAGADAFASGYLAYKQSAYKAQFAELTADLTRQAKALNRSITQVTGQISAVSSTSSAHEDLTIRRDQLTAELTKVNADLTQLPGFNLSGGSLIKAAPGTRSGLSRSLIVILATLIGLLIGLIVAFVRDVFDDRVRDAGQLEKKLGAATLAVLGDVSSEQSGGSQRRGRTVVTTVANPVGRSADGARTLRTTLVAAAVREDVRTILVVAADASMSSSHITAELGVTLAESGRRVLLVAADMRGSLLPQIFDVPNSVGLSDLLTGGGDAETLTRQPGLIGGAALPSSILRRLNVLPSGLPTPQALSVLDSNVMLGLLRGQRESYDFVILDSPPATVAADVVALATHVDGVIVLARKGRTRGRALEDLRRRLDQVGARLIGGVFVVKGAPGKHARGSSAPADSGSALPAGARRRDADYDVAPPAAARRPVAPVTRPIPAVADGSEARGPRGLEDRPPRSPAGNDDQRGADGDVWAAPQKRS